MTEQTDWRGTLDELLERYGTRKHPLEYKNRYQLVVMVLLSAQDSDAHINSLAPSLFHAFPSMKDLAKANSDSLLRLIGSVRNSQVKARWLCELAQAVGADERIPTTLPDLVKLPGIGRKSANVIIRESGGTAEGIIVDLHVVRVAPRIGIVDEGTPEKIEKGLMAELPREIWNQAGMAFSFLGREICRPTNPKCDVCPMNPVCRYYKTEVLPRKTAK